MKRYFNLVSFILIAGMVMQSCKEELAVSSAGKTVPPKKVVRMSQNSYEQLLEELDDLDLSYGLTSVSEIAEYEGWDFADMGSDWDIVSADAEGANAGAEIGKEIGGTKGAIIGAVIGGAVGSLAEFFLKRNDENSNVNEHANEQGNEEEQAAMDISNPFDYNPRSNRFSYGGLAPIGSEIGELHNWLVYEMLASMSPTTVTLEDVLEYAYSTNFTTLSTHFTPQQIMDVQAYFYENKTEVLSYFGESGLSILYQDNPEEMNIIKHYAFVLSQTTQFFDRFQYTMDFMNLIDYEYNNGSISKESAELINGTISTLYCSKTAWNYIQPNPFFTNKFIVCGNNSWYLTENQESLASLLSGLQDIGFVGYPYIDNDTVKRIYIYANSPENMNLQYNIASLLADETFTNTVDTVYNIDNNSNCLPIATGIYPILPAAGYDDYVYIDLEQWLDIINL